MKLVNPVGRSVQSYNANSEVTPKGCVCSSGSATTNAGGGCFTCGCQCDASYLNDSNSFKAFIRPWG